MKEYQRLSHTRWDCKYHVVFIPKKRKKRIFGALRKQPGNIFHDRLDEAIVRAYIRNQEHEDEHYEQMKLGV